MNRLTRLFVTNTWLHGRWLFAATVLLFLGLMARFYSAEHGFTALILFGENNEERFIPELKKLEYFVDEQSWGYDAQWYAQLAMRPQLDDPAMMEAIDNLPYRARRMLFSWTAYAVGLGQPAWVLQVYALQNVVCWLLLAWLMLRWFGPLDFNNLIRWWGVLFSYGLVVSVRCALVDGPSLLLIAWGMVLLESKRVWMASIVMGVGALGKETNLLSAAAFCEPRASTLKAWAGVFGRGTLVVLPLAVWVAWLFWALGSNGMDAGSRNFALPFVQLWHKIAETMGDLISGTAKLEFALSNVYMLVALLTQFLFIALRPQWRNAWWRVGAAYAALMIVLGEAVWEGYPGAASRVLLPMLLAFNILVPKGRKWWIVLLLGNLSVISSPGLLMTPPGFGKAVAGPVELRRNEVSGQWLTVDFGRDWLPPSQTIWDYWRWSEGSASLTVNNPHSQALAVTLDFKMSSLSSREVRLEMDGARVWTQMIDGERRAATVHLVLKPGATKLDFITPQPSDDAGNPNDARKRGFRLFDFRVTARELK